MALPTHEFDAADATRRKGCAALFDDVLNAALSRIEG
jgi:hypothetical protein